jgi:hypothetical protein
MEADMTPADFTTEKTPVGMQYVIPGTERITIPKRRTFTADGNQLVIPGAERISTGAYLKRLSEKPMQSRRGQIGRVVRGCLETDSLALAAPQGDVAY